MLTYFLSTETLKKGRRETKLQTDQECANKDVKTRSRRNKAQLEANKKHIKNLSNKQLPEGQINLLAKGLKFIPTPVKKDNQIRQQLLRDFEQLARKMRLHYIRCRKGITFFLREIKLESTSATICNPRKLFRGG